MRYIDIDTDVTCPVCRRVETAFVILETATDGREFIACGTCKRPYYRKGASTRFVSPDGHSFLVPTATLPATV